MSLSFEQPGDAGLAAVRVKYLGLLRRLTGCKEEEFGFREGDSVRSLMLHVAERYGSDLAGELMTVCGDQVWLYNDVVLVLLNGVNVSRIDGLETRLDGGCTEILLMTSIAGG